MGKIFGGIEGIVKEKEWDNESDKKYIADLKAWCLANKPGKNSGEIVEFQYADGYAKYMVASMKPLELIHLNVDDAWELPHVNRLTAQDIQKNLDFKNFLKGLRKAEPESETIEIISALYGIEGKMVPMKSVTFDKKLNNKMAGSDPAPGVKKFATITFLKGGIEYTSKFSEGEVLTTGTI
jgi:hypothetical protein